MTPAQFLNESTMLYCEFEAMMGRGADAYVESQLEPLRLELERTRQLISAPWDKSDIPLVSRDQGTSQIDIHEKDIPHDKAFRRWLREKIAFCCKMINKTN